MSDTSWLLSDATYQSTLFVLCQASRVVPAIWFSFVAKSPLGFLAGLIAFGFSGWPFYGTREEIYGWIYAFIFTFQAKPTWGSYQLR
jgi:hypothetical protein